MPVCGRRDRPVSIGWIPRVCSPAGTQAPRSSCATAVDMLDVFIDLAIDVGLRAHRPEVAQIAS